MNSKGRDLLESSNRLITAVVERMKQMHSSGQVSWRTESRLEIHPSNMLTLPTRNVIDWHVLAFRAESALENTPVYQQFTEALEKDERIGHTINAMIGTHRERRRVRPCDFLQLLMSKLLEYTDNDLDATNSRFDQALNFVVASLLADHVITRFWCILENAEVPEGSTEIMPGIIVRGLTVPEVESLWNRNGFVQSYYPFYDPIAPTGPTIRDVQTLLETEIKEETFVGECDVEPTTTNEFSNVRSSFESICTCFRLLRSEPIALTPIIAERDNPWLSTSVHRSMEGRAARLHVKCPLSAQDLDEVRKLLKVVSRGETGLGRATSVCLRRIGFANLRTSPEDKLLDTVMALEAMILSDSGDPKDRGELSFRLAIRLAKFLGGNRSDQTKTFELLRKAYRLRSKIVHGDQLRADDLSTINDLEVITRAAARKYLHNLATGNPVDWTSLLFN